MIRRSTLISQIFFSLIFTFFNFSDKKPCLPTYRHTHTKFSLETDLVELTKFKNLKYDSLSLLYYVQLYHPTPKAQAIPRTQQALGEQERPINFGFQSKLDGQL